MTIIFSDPTIKKSSKSISKVILPSSKNNMLNVGETHKMPLWLQAPHEKGTHRLDLLFYYESVDSKIIPKHRLCRHTWQLKVLDSIQITAVVARSGLSKNDSPTLNLIMSIKNMVQGYDGCVNEIMLFKVLFQSAIWTVFHSSVLPQDIKIKPQEMFHLMLKLRKKADTASNMSEVLLTSDVDDTALIEDYPCINFVQRRHIQPLDVNENSNDMQQYQTQQNAERNLLSDTILNSMIIIRWCANVIENDEKNTRKVMGQHHLELQYLNKTYKHPKESQISRNEYGVRLKVFGPERNVPNIMTTPMTDSVLEAECLKSVISFSLIHKRQIIHNFQRNRLCIVPVTMYLQNHSKMQVDVKINTIGTNR